MHKSLVKKIKTKVTYDSERNFQLERVAMYFNEAVDKDPIYVDKRFYGCLPTGYEFLNDWAEDKEYRHRLLKADIQCFYDYWDKDKGMVSGFISEDGSISEVMEAVIISNFEEGVLRAKCGTAKVISEKYTNHDDYHLSMSPKQITIWIAYGYFCWQTYWLRSLNPSSKGLSI
jgi:hypothetical protein